MVVKNKDSIMAKTIAATKHDSNIPLLSVMPIKTPSHIKAPMPAIGIKATHSR